MKKTYIKPTGSHILLAVNENIAASAGGGEIFTQPVGALTFTHATPRCNDYLNSTRIDTGLRDDCFNVDHLMENLRATASAGGEFANQAAELLHMLETMGPEGFNCA